MIAPGLGLYFVDTLVLQNSDTIQSESSNGNLRELHYVRI
jgi:hypothetical protein